MDIKPIMDQYGGVPIILAKKENAIDEIILPENAIQRQKKTDNIFAQVEENGRETEFTYRTVAADEQTISGD